MIVVFIALAFAVPDDDAVKKEYGLLIQNVILDEVGKSIHRVNLAKQLRSMVFDAIEFENIARSPPSELQSLKEQIRDLRKQIRQEEWEDVKLRLENRKKMERERLRMQVQNILPVVPEQQFLPMYPPFPNFQGGYQAFDQPYDLNSDDRCRRHRRHHSKK